MTIRKTIMKAKAIKDTVPVLNQFFFGNEHSFETSCVDYEDYEMLPDAVELKGRIYVKTGWNSDRGRAYYKTGRPIAKAI
jgi:hypothetical protein